MSTGTLALLCCRGCNAEVEKIDARGKPRLKRACKRMGDVAYCRKCWCERFFLRAVTFPVVGPVGVEWPELRKALAEAWSQSTSLANWFATELYASDIRREPGQTKLAAMPDTYLYPKARERFPDYPSALLVSVEHAVKGKYRAKRYDLLWLGECSLPSFRYPIPYTVSGQNWKAEFGPDNVPLVNVGINRERFALRLRGGSEFRRQLASFRQIVDGSAAQGELALYRVRAGESDGRNGIKTGETGRPMWRVMCKLVAWLPRVELSKPDKSRFFLLRTDKDALLYGVLQDREEPWIVNADRVRDWVHQHQRWLQRAAEDTKAEIRKPKRRKRRLLADYDRHAEKHRHRMKSFIQETAAAVAGFAKRNGATVIKYDDRETGFLSRFPWFQLKRQLAMKLDECGIDFQVASGVVAANCRAPLAENAKDEVEAC